MNSEHELKTPTGLVVPRCGDTPRKGGRITVGSIGAGALTTLDPVHVFNAGDLLRALQLYEPLFTLSADLRTIEPVLAVSAEPNADASVWTLRLREGVSWHDGSPFTAADVIHSFNYWADSVFSSVARLIDFARLRVLDPLTLRVPLIQACAEWPSTLTIHGLSVVKAGTVRGSIDSAPNGTGPFKCQSFSRAGSLLVANRSYWQEDRPYVDELVFDTSFENEDDRLAALSAGRIDVMPTCPLAEASRRQTNPDVVVLAAPSPWPYPLIMRVDQGPLADPRIRRAMKLIADRPAMVDAAWAGMGQVGNDLFCDGEQYDYFASDLEIHQDIDQARHLLKAAGVDGETFTMTTSPTAGGVMDAAHLFAREADKAGVSIKLNQVAPDLFYTPQAGFLERCFSAGSYYAPAGSLTATYLVLFSRYSTVNESRWGYQDGGNASWDLIDAAVAATDPVRAAELWYDVQRQQFDGGGFLIWGNAHAANLVSPRVHGLSEGAVGWLNSARFLDAWTELST